MPDSPRGCLDSGSVRRSRGRDGCPRGMLGRGCASLRFGIGRDGDAGAGLERARPDRTPAVLRSGDDDGCRRSRTVRRRTRRVDGSPCRDRGGGRRGEPHEVARRRRRGVRRRAGSADRGLRVRRPIDPRAVVRTGDEPRCRRHGADHGDVGARTGRVRCLRARPPRLRSTASGRTHRCARPAEQLPHPWARRADRPGACRVGRSRRRAVGMG